MKGGYLFLIIATIFLPIGSAGAEEIRINEVAWMGTSDSYADEWIELKNTGGKEIDVTGWKLVDKPDSPKEERLQINLASTTIEKGGVFLLERTDQKTLPDIDGDQIYTGGLKNNGNDGRGLVLMNKEEEVVDRIEAECDGSKEECEWPAGDNDSKQTMIYCDGEWLSSPEPGGSPKEENSCPEPAKDPNKKEQNYREPDGGDSDKGPEKKEKRESDGQKEDEENKKKEESEETEKKKDRDKRLEVGGKRDKDKDQKRQGELVMTEILPDPVEGSKEEFIEFYNKGEKKVELKDWKIKNDLGQELVFGGVAARAAGITREVVEPEEHLVLSRKKTKLVLNDNGGKIELFSPDSDTPEQTLNYGRAEPGFSYVSTDHIDPDRLSTSTEEFFVHSKTIKDRAWSKRSTPGGFNQIHSKNRPPTPLFSFFGDKEPKSSLTFDAADTFDQDGDELIYRWRFGDGVEVEDIVSPTHSYLEAGEYRVTLFVSDGRETAELNKDIVIGEQNSDSEDEAEKEEERSDPREEPGPLEPGVVINEVFPAPAKDKEAWVELLNTGKEEMNIVDWRLKNKNSSYRFSENSEEVSLDPQQIYLVKQDSRWLELEKEKDFVELAHESGSVMDRVEYDRVFSGESLARGPGGEVFWTTVPTPGEENEISVENSSQLDSVLSDVSAGDSRQSKDPFKDISLEKVRELPPEKKVRTEGVVAVKPGVLGKQYFYIIGSPGVQIYNFHTDFPDLKPGDKVEVKGEISETRYGEKRINTDDRRDIRLLEDTEPPRPEPVTGEELNNGNQAGRLVKMTGEIVDKKRKKFYIKEDSDRTLVYLQEDLGVSTGDIKEGAEAEVVGLVSKFRDGVRVLPRSAQDINLSENKKKDSEVGTSASGTPATSAEADPAREEWILPSQEKDNNLIKYLLVISGAVIVILTVLLYRKGSNS